MKLHGIFIAGLGAFSLISAAALAQTDPAAQPPSASKLAAENGADASSTAQKQHTQGSAGVVPQQYGGAQKQHTQGTAGFEPQQYGTDWARTRKQSNNQ